MATYTFEDTKDYETASAAFKKLNGRVPNDLDALGIQLQVLSWELADLRKVVDTLTSPRAV